jgi:hypothetical protein
MTISLDELGLTNPQRADDFAERCAFTKSLTIRFSTDILWSSDDPSDRAYDWLAVLMFGEFLATLETQPYFSIVHVGDAVMAVDFTLKSNITSTTFTRIMQYGAALLAFQTEGTATCHFAATDIMDYEATILDFQDDIQNHVATFTDLAAMYVAEFIAGQQADGEPANEYTMLLSSWVQSNSSTRVSA